jgi:D-beta-D-heptose 7-phosphate kinase/D-beta-D-heptose 1-phosphate adenosyltransferase
VRSVLTETERSILQNWRSTGERVVFTNGVFDLLHRGHVEYLEEARALGDRLVVGLNTDASVRRLKGSRRPLVPETERAVVLAALECVDLVVPFEDDTPAKLIEAVTPEVLVKGGDYRPDQIVGREWVEAHGGRVVAVPYRPGLSTSALVERILAGKSARDP